jgi:hypothetical protein
MVAASLGVARANLTRRSIFLAEKLTRRSLPSPRPCASIKYCAQQREEKQLDSGSIDRCVLPSSDLALVAMDTRLVLVALAAFLAAPLLRPCSPPGSLDSIASWAMKGPAKNLPPGMNGVYVLKGQNPALLVDFSYAHSYVPATRSFTVDAGRAMLFDTGAVASQFKGEFRSTTPATDFSGKALSLVMRVMRLSLKFEFNENYSVATIYPSMFSPYFPVNFVFHQLVKEQAVAHKGGWKRVNFVPAKNTTASDAFAFMHPVVTRKPDGSLKVHGDGLKMAKRKLAMGSGAFAQC